MIKVFTKGALAMAAFCCMLPATGSAATIFSFGTVTGGTVSLSGSTVTSISGLSLGSVSSISGNNCSSGCSVSNLVLNYSNDVLTIGTTSAGGLGGTTLSNIGASTTLLTIDYSGSGLQDVSNSIALSTNASAAYANGTFLTDLGSAFIEQAFTSSNIGGSSVSAAGGSATLTFSTSLAPEPSTTVLLGVCVATALCVAGRKRLQGTAAQR